MRHFSGEFSGLRLLMLDELDAIAGGQSEDVDSAPAGDLSEVIVTYRNDNNRQQQLIPLAWFLGAQGVSWGNWTGAGTSGDGDAETVDAESVRIDINFDRALTASEQAAVDRLSYSTRLVSDAISKIPDTASITMADGGVVTGAQLKTMWQYADFRINEVGTSYANGTTRGEANYNNGNPLISYNIDLLVDYDAHQVPGLNYLIAHEIGHMTQAGRNFWAAAQAGGVTPAENAANEIYASDIGRAITTTGGLSILADPSRYSPGAALVFGP